MPQEQQSKKGCAKAGRNKVKVARYYNSGRLMRRKLRNIANNNVPRPIRLRHCGHAMEKLKATANQPMWREMHGVNHEAYACRVCKKVKWFPIADLKAYVPNSEERWATAKDIYNRSRHVPQTA